MHAFVFSCLAIVALGVLYEWLREAQKVADLKIAATISAQSKGKARGGTVSGRSSPEIGSEEAGLLTGLRTTKANKGCVCMLFPFVFRDVLISKLALLSQ
jgi:solute carrier family 31 (copper transporter), member 1